MAAQGRQQLTDLSQVQQRVASFGILPEEADSQPVDGEQAEQETEGEQIVESDERESADASIGSQESETETDADTAEGDTPKDKGSKKGQGDSRVAALEERIARAEEMERKWQSRYDRATAQLERVAARAGGQQAGPTDDGSDLGIPDNDDLISNKDLKKLMDKMASNQRATNQSAAGSTKRQQWIASREDVQAVVKYMQTNDLYAEDSPLRGVPTDEIGLYAIAKNMKLEAELKAADKRVADEVAKARADERKKLLKNGGRTRVPDTGGNGAPGKSRSTGESLEPASQSEQDYLSFFKRLGMPAQIVAVRRG